MWRIFVNKGRRRITIFSLLFVVAVFFYLSIVSLAWLFEGSDVGLQDPRAEAVVKVNQDRGEFADFEIPAQQINQSKQAAGASKTTVSPLAPNVVYGKKIRNYQTLTNIAQYRFDRYNRRNDPDDRPGAWGKPYRLQLSDEEKKKEEELIKKEAFNIMVSEQIPMNRTIPDLRIKECRALTYNISNLPVASVVLIFNNEAWTTLMRTAHSVINRSPPELLKEVVLVDDFSDREELTGTKLEDYARKEWPDGIVKVVHLPERSGLIVARQRGAEASTGDVVVFLDAHCEASEGWLEPILQRIYDKRTAVVCPIIGGVSAKDFSVNAGGSGSGVGGFWWSLHFSWKSTPKREQRRRKGPTDTVMSPTMAGGLLASERDVSSGLL